MIAILIIKAVYFLVMFLYCLWQLWTMIGQ
jgi:hypothetical protein